MMIDDDDDDDDDGRKHTTVCITMYCMHLFVFHFYTTHTHTQTHKFDCYYMENIYDVHVVIKITVKYDLCKNIPMYIHIIYRVITVIPSTRNFCDFPSIAV